MNKWQSNIHSRTCIFLQSDIYVSFRNDAPEDSETISYQMPAFKLNDALAYFAAFKNHIGFYPTPSGIKKFKKELSPYKGGKGSVQFPMEKPIPYDLVKKKLSYLE